MSEIELKNVDYRIIDDETIMVYSCPICKSNETLWIGIYRDSPEECKQCHTKFNITMRGATIFKII